MAAAGTAAANSHRNFRVQTGKGASTGKYQLDYSGQWTNSPSVVVVDASGAQDHVRINHADAKRDRRSQVEVDSFRLDLDTSGGKVTATDAAFQAIAARSSDGIQNLKLRGDSGAEILVVAGAVDGDVEVS